MNAAVATGKTKMSTGACFSWGGMAFLSAAVALVSLRYLFGKGPVPDNIALNPYVDPWIIVHAAGAATALLLGPLQFLSGLRQRKPMFHRMTGRLYVTGCLIGGVSALILATGVTAGPIAGAGFGALGVAWLVTTGLGLHHILNRRVRAHERWMIRSFALTLSAVTLRIYLPLFSALGFNFPLIYRTISWMCWVPNLLLAEWYLARRQHQLTHRDYGGSATPDPMPAEPVHRPARQ